MALLAPTGLAATSLTVEISNQNANEAHFMKAFDAPSVATGDFDGDGRLEMVAHNDNQYVYVISTASPRILAEFRPDYPGGWGVRPINDPVVDDVDNDGRLDIVVVTSAGHVCVYEYTGGRDPMQFEKRWCKRMDAYDGTETAADGGAAVADVDGDGRKEIFAQTETKGLYAFNHDGGVRWSKDRFGGNAGPLVSDLDGDRKLEVVFFSDGGTVTAWDASSGNQKWGFWAGNHGIRPGSIPVSGNAADLDGDGKKEVVFVARHAVHCCTVDDYRQNHFGLFVLNAFGGLRWMRQPDWGNPMSYTHPILEDVDGDGKREILLMDWNTIGHLPGDWEKLGQANVFSYEHNGALNWRTQVDDSWSNDDLALADVDGDGVQELLAIGYGPGGDGIWYIDARNGVKEQHVYTGPKTNLRGPIAADFDKDGDVDWAIPQNTVEGGGSFRVFRTDARPCRIAFGGWEVKDPCRDGSTAPPPPPGGGGTPPPSGDFDVTFRPKAGNEWWVEVFIDNANKPLAGVDARANGGAWNALTKRSWGAWAGSFSVPDGSVVEFRARATDGDAEISGKYCWPAAAPTTGTCEGAPPPAGGDFSATFRPKAGNEWWVEVFIDNANKPLAGVDARANGGAWNALTKRSWGAWAGSFSVPDGSVVEFRARATSGEQLVSGKYCWPQATSTSGTCGGAPPPGGGGGFSATFRNARGNDWWVEVDVDASKTLSGVDARVNGGAWNALTKQDWGSWAKSLNAPPGSTVEFRARATSGETAISGKFNWPP